MVAKEVVCSGDATERRQQRGDARLICRTIVTDQIGILIDLRDSVSSIRQPTPAINRLHMLDVQTYSYRARVGGERASERGPVIDISGIGATEHVVNIGKQTNERKRNLRSKRTIFLQGGSWGSCLGNVMVFIEISQGGLVRRDGRP